jgi:hypothetical protein
MRLHQCVYGLIALCVITIGPAVSPAAAADTLGGHVGFVLPLVAHANGQTTTITDHFSIGFPMGITVRKSDTLAFDLELVPGVDHDPLHVDLTVHPGVVFGVGNGWGAGVRAAFDVNKASVGFTPILNHGLLKVGDTGTLFGELVLPVRFQQDARGNSFTSVGFGVHIGVGF